MDNLIYKYAHWRIDSDDGELKRYHRGISEWKPAPRNGATLCQIFNKKGFLLAHGATECGDHPFSYRDGRVKARFRARLARKLTLDKK